jgi:cytochrome c oxidase subunit 2
VLLVLTALPTLPAPFASLAFGIQQEPGDSYHGWHDILAKITTIYRKILNLPEQGSTIAPAIDYLHFLEITVMNAVALLIASVVIYCVIRFRRRPGAEPTPHVRPPVIAELGLYVFLFSLFTFFWVVGFRQFIRMLEAPADAVDIYVVGKQWMWKFSYPEGPASVGVLYVPAGRAVRLHLTSRDVIHSFFVPEFRIKRDAVPGMYTTIWFQANAPGVYLGLCAEMCGVGHSQMRAGVVALRPEEYDLWLRNRAPLPAELPGRVPPYGEEPTLLEGQQRMAVLGRDVAARHGCLKCHSIDGSDHIGPTWYNLYGAWETMADGTLQHVDEAYITKYIMDPNFKRVAGFEPIMPSFMGQITPGEIAAIIEYMKALSTAPEQRHGNPIFRGPTLAPFRPPPGADTIPARR